MAGVNWTNVTGVDAFLQMPNTTTGGYFWLAMLLLIYIVLFVSMLGFGFTPAIISASFAALMIGILMAYIGLVSWTYVVIIAGVLIFTFIWVMYSSRGD